MYTQSLTAYGGYMNAVRKSAWKVDWEGTIHCLTRLLDLHQQLAGPMAQPPELHPHPISLCLTPKENISWKKGLHKTGVEYLFGY